MADNVQSKYSMSCWSTPCDTIDDIVYLHLNHEINQLQHSNLITVYKSSGCYKLLIIRKQNDQCHHGPLLVRLLNDILCSSQWPD